MKSINMKETDLCDIDGLLRGTLAKMSREELKILMENIPDSYDDFVNCTVRWMIKDGRIQKAILTQLRDKPESDTSDVLEVLCDCLGLGEPLELVDDDEEDFYDDAVETATRTSGMARLARI